MDYSMLLSPMKIGNLEIKNRTVMTAAEFSMGPTASPRKSSWTTMRSGPRVAWD